MTFILATWSFVEPYMMNFDPAAFVATFPPIELEDDEAKEIGSKRPFSATKLFTLSVIAPAWHTTWFFSETHFTSFIFSRDTTISLFAAVAPPHKPVLPPEITNF